MGIKFWEAVCDEHPLQRSRHPLQVPSTSALAHAPPTYQAHRAHPHLSLLHVLTRAQRTRVHFCPQNWLLCHLGLYWLEFEFARYRRQRRVLRRSDSHLGRINVFYHEALGGKYAPRAVLFDPEPGVAGAVAISRRSASSSAQTTA
jgi:hypothetical protein